MIKAVLFDLRDTLLEVSQGYQASFEFLYSYLAKLVPNLDKEILQQDLKDSRTKVISQHGTNTSIHNWDALFLKDLFKNYQISLSTQEYAQFLEDYAKSFAQKVTLYPDAREVLNLLKEKNIKTGVVIDGTTQRERMILKLTGLEKLLDTVTISEEVGQNKFSDKPLQDALEKIAVDPKNILVVGDRLDKDIIHANKAGCTSIRLVRKQGRYSDVEIINPEEKPDYIINTLLEIVPLLEN